MCLMTEVFLPRRPLQFEHLLGQVAPADVERARRLRRAARRCRRPPPSRRIFWRWPMHALRPARARAPAAGWPAAARASPLILATQALLRRNRESPAPCGRPRISAEVARWRSICACTCAGVLSESHIVSILFSTTRRESMLSASVIRCSRQIARSDLVTPVSAARMNTTAWACGIRFTVSSGSAPMAFRPGRVQDHQPLLEQRMRRC